VLGKACAGKATGDCLEFRIGVRYDWHEALLPASSRRRLSHEFAAATLNHICAEAFAAFFPIAQHPAAQTEPDYDPVQRIFLGFFLQQGLTFALGRDSRKPVRLVDPQFRQRSIQALAVFLTDVQLAPFELDCDDRPVSLEDEQIHVMPGVRYVLPRQHSPHRIFTDVAPEVVIHSALHIGFLDDSQSLEIAHEFIGEFLSDELLDLLERSLLSTRHDKYDM
jgi:hypothetical protein